MTFLLLWLLAGIIGTGIYSIKYKYNPCIKELTIGIGLGFITLITSLVCGDVECL